MLTHCSIATQDGVRGYQKMTVLARFLHGRPGTNQDADLINHVDFAFCIAIYI
jgi:hypothetical protein